MTSPSLCTVRLPTRRSCRATSRWPAAANMATGANLTNWKQWVLGAQFGFAGFTVGGAVG